MVENKVMRERLVRRLWGRLKKRPSRSVKNIAPWRPARSKKISRPRVSLNRLWRSPRPRTIIRRLPVGSLLTKRNKQYKAAQYFARASCAIVFSQVTERRTTSDCVNNRGLAQSLFSERRIDKDQYKKTWFTASSRLRSDQLRTLVVIFESTQRELVVDEDYFAWRPWRYTADTTSEWRLIKVPLSPLRLTRPPREFLALWDVRVRRRTSSLWRPPSPLSSLERTPSRTPRTSARVHRGVQCCPEISVKATQSQQEKLTPPATRSTGTQVEAPARSDTSTQTPQGNQGSHTPLGTPPKR